MHNTAELVDDAVDDASNGVNHFSRGVQYFAAAKQQNIEEQVHLLSILVSDGNSDANQAPTMPPMDGEGIRILLTLCLY